MPSNGKPKIPPVPDLPPRLPSPGAPVTVTHYKRLPCGHLAGTIVKYDPFRRAFLIRLECGRQVWVSRSGFTLKEGGAE
jgi:hypothetical protein